MITLSKGFKLPETGDFGNIWFPAMEDNINQMNTHDHDGVDSEKISALNLDADVTTVLSASFADQGDGYWRATVTVPGGAFVDNLVVTVKDPTTKEPVYLRMVKLSATQFYIYTNFVQDFEVYFGI